MRTLAVAFVLALVPSQLEAQVYPGGQPLAIYCMSYAQEYCVSFLTWEENLNYHARDADGRVYITDDPSEAFVAQGSAVTTGHVFGSAYESPPLLNPWLEVNALTTDEWGFPVLWVMTSVGMIEPGYFRWGESTAGLLPGPEVPDYGTGADAVTMVQFDAGISCSPFGRNERLPACVEVPEPASALLVATGLLGLAYVRRRRTQRPEDSRGPRLLVSPAHVGHDPPPAFLRERHHVGVCVLHVVPPRDTLSSGRLLVVDIGGAAHVRHHLARVPPDSGNPILA